MSMVGNWNDLTVERLLDQTLCPVCGSAALVMGRCPVCRADLSGPHGAELWSASQSAAAALRTREEVRRRVPRIADGTWAVPGEGQRMPMPTAPLQPVPHQPVPHQPVPHQQVPHQAATAGPPPFGAPPAPAAAPAPAPSSATLQSVLATAGAALFAVAAIVFTFFNPDLADQAARGWIVGAVTLVFLGASWLFAHRDLRFSAEAVGALGVIFVGLDVHAIAQVAVPPVSPWVLAAISTAVAGGLLLLAGLRRGIRVWVWSSLLGIALVPAMIGTAVGLPLASALGLLAAAVLAAALTTALPVIARHLRVPQALPTGATATTTPTPAAPTPTPAPTTTPTPPRVLGAEQAALTALQVMLVLGAVVSVYTPETYAMYTPETYAIIFAVAAAHALYATRNPLPRLWSVLAGVFAAGAAAAATFATLMNTDTSLDVWSPVLTAAVTIVLVVTALAPLPRTALRGAVAAGTTAVVAVSLLPAAYVVLEVGGTLVRTFLIAGLPDGLEPSTGGVGSPGIVAGGVVAVAISALGAWAFALAAARLGRTPSAVPFARAGAVVLGTVAVLAWAALPAMAPVLGLVVALLAAAAGVLLSRRVTPAIRVLLLAGGILALLVAVMLTWPGAPALIPYAGAATVAVALLFAAVGPRSLRAVWVGAAYGYALIVIAGTLGLLGVGAVAQLCLTASVGLLGAIAATFVPRVGARSWQAILLVSAVPFGIAVAQVTVQRSGWTALSTALMFALALTLTLTRRPGLTLIVRTLAAALLVPSLAVVIVCLGAEMLEQSGSPVVLPIIAVLVALVLPSTDLLRRALLARGLGARSSVAARVAVEASTLVTAVIAVGLSFARDAAGIGTACLVLLIIGVGGLLTGLLARRRYGWWLAGVALTGSLWSAWALNGVTVAEAYLLPPSLGAALVALVLTARGRAATSLFAAGLAAAVVPLVVLSAVAPSTEGGPSGRVIGLLAAASVLLATIGVLATRTGSGVRRLRTLRLPAAVAAGVGALAGTVQAVRWGSGLDGADAWTPASMFLAALALSAASLLGGLLAARAIRSGARANARIRGSRWFEVPALLAFVVGAWATIERDWFVIWGIWALMLALLVLVVITAVRSARMPTILPPVWMLFAMAFVTAIVAWSPRDLRVEWFSLPLGLFLLVAGAQGLRHAPAGGTAAGDATAGDAPRGTLADWPGRWRGSWPLLAPGLIVMMSASIVATFTDPLTWRAVLVMVMALAAILLGSSCRLAAPFLIGLVVLPVENVFVFAVQLGRGIEAMPWWITLAVIGAVLLIIAVTSERRAGEGRGVAARVRDLR